MAAHSSVLAWRIPWTKDSSWLQVHGVAKSRTWLSDLYTWDLWSLRSLISSYTGEKTEARRCVCFPKVTKIKRWSSVLIEMFLHPKATSCLGINVLLPVTRLWSSLLVSLMFYAGNCSDMNSYNVGKTFPSLLKIVYKLPSSLWIFFCLTLSVWSLLTSFCLHWTILDAASFSSFWGRHFCFKHADIIPAFSILHGPHTVFDRFSTAGIPWGTLSQLVLLVEWLCTVVGTTQTHTHRHASVQDGSYVEIE